MRRTGERGSRGMWRPWVLAAAVVAAAWPAAGVAQEPLPPRATVEGWQVRPSQSTDLWYHTLAVLQADQPGPLGLYSADYARRIREIKQGRGVFPTRLDSVAPALRRAIAEDTGFATLLHFAPLYFDNPTPERLLRAVEAAARRRFDDTRLQGPDTRLGMLIVAQNVERSAQRRVVLRLVEAMEAEWETFYRDYWEEQRRDLEPAYESIQAMWDSLLAPQLGRYLERSRLTSGVLMPSPGLGPEGRIVDYDQADANDQIVAVQLPLGPGGPETAVFSFLKELCFLLEDEELFGDDPPRGAAMEGARRLVAVRCGAMLLEFYAPAYTARYRRVFLDAVGAEESATVEAFERVYALEPGLYERLRERIRGR